MSVLSPDNPSTSLGLPRIPVFLKTIANATTDSGGPVDWSNRASYLLRGKNRDTNETSLTFFGSPVHRAVQNFCKQALIQRISGISVRYWDVAILLPNLLFLLFLIIKYRQVQQKLRQIRSPVFKIFFLLVYVTTVVNTIRCLTSICIGTTNQVGEIVDKVLWLVLKFFLFSSELCVLVFGLFFGHLDSRASIRNAFAGALFISLVHLILQAVLEFTVQGKAYTYDASVFDIFTHGGIGLWMVSSAAFVLIYSLSCLLPYTCIRRFITLPVKCSFYAYCLILMMLNVAQMIGAALILTDCLDGICIADLTTFIYFTMYTPLVYFVFLRRSLSMNASNGGPMFSYRKHKDETVTGDLPDTSTYYPRFSGLTSPSYDDLFDCDTSRQLHHGLDATIHHNFYHRNDVEQLRKDDKNEVPLMLAMNSNTPDSTATTQLDYDCSLDYAKPLSSASSFEDRVSTMKPSQYDVGSMTSFGTAPRHLRGLGPNGTLIFSEAPDPSAGLSSD